MIEALLVLEILNRLGLQNGLFMETFGDHKGEKQEKFDSGNFDDNAIHGLR